MDKPSLPAINPKAENMLLLVIAITFFLLLNLMYFISVAASPIIRDDGWYFLASQIQPWIEQGFSWTDIFVKRDLTDHAQPLNKLFLYLNYQLFNLDFRYEAIAGFVGVFCTVFLFLSSYIKKTISQSSSLCSAGFFVLAMLTLTSLNSRELYSWPLVTFSYLPFFLALLLPFFAWRFLNYQLTIGSIVIAALIFVVIGDTASIIAWLSLTAAIALITFSDSEISKKRVALWIACTALVVATYFIIINIHFIGGPAQPKADSKNLDLLSPGFYLEFFRIVFSSSLIHPEHLARAGSYQTLLSWLVAIPVLYFFVAHFVSLVFKKQRQTLISFVVTFVLIYATLSITAIVVGRVPEFGIGYLNQPRYVLVYQLIPFALFIKYCFLPAQARWKAIARTIAVTIALPIMLCAQFYFSSNAYAVVPWIAKWVDGQSRAIADYVSDPALPAGNCTSFSTPVCNLSQTERNELLTVMMKHQLNIFNHDFQWKYKIFPLIQIKAPPVSAWGPQVISARSSAGIWIKLSTPIVSSDVKAQVNINGKPVEKTVFMGDVITFYLPDEYKSIPGFYTIEYSIDDWKSSMLVGDVEVTH
jgi:hypothetical protein